MSIVHVHTERADMNSSINLSVTCSPFDLIADELEGGD